MKNFLFWLVTVGYWAGVAVMLRGLLNLGAFLDGAVSSGDLSMSAINTGIVVIFALVLVVAVLVFAIRKVLERKWEKEFWAKFEVDKILHASLEDLVQRELNKKEEYL